ncbi:MAG: hypothetical protein ACLUFI_00850 [Oscillospiraceae bacterium]
MSGANLQHLLAMVLYMAAVVGIGIYFAGRANKDAESYFLGGRSLGPWVTAFSAEASDMSGYLLMEPARPRVLDGSCRRGLDLHRPCHRHISQLPDRLQAAAPLFDRRERLHAPGFLLEPLP